MAPDQALDLGQHQLDCCDPGVVCELRRKEAILVEGWALERGEVASVADSLCLLLCRERTTTCIRQTRSN